MKRKDLIRLFEKMDGGWYVPEEIMTFTQTVRNRKRFPVTKK